MGADLGDWRHLSAGHRSGPGGGLPPARFGDCRNRRARSGERLRLALDGAGDPRLDAGEVRAALGACVLIPAVLLQVTLAPNLSVAGAFPNLVLLVVVGWTLVAGPGSGLRLALAGGLLLDLVAPGPFGLHALALATAAYAAGWCQRSFHADRLLLPFATGGVAAGVSHPVPVDAALFPLHGDRREGRHRPQLASLRAAGHRGRGVQPVGSHHPNPPAPDRSRAGRHLRPPRLAARV